MKEIDFGTGTILEPLQNEQHDLGIELEKFPFKSVLSLKPLIKYWKTANREKHKIKSKFTQPVLDKLESAPELSMPIEDPAVLKKHEDLVDVLMSINYSPAKWDNQISASIVPFMFKPFYSTPLYDKIMDLSDEEAYKKFNVNKSMWLIGKSFKAYSFILKKFYNVDIDVFTDMIVNIHDDVTGFDNYYKLEFDIKFVDIVVNGKLPKLSDDQVQSLIKGISSIKLMMELLPPEKFEFHGFVTVTAFDVTDQQILSTLKNDLLEKEAIISTERFYTLQNKLRSLFRISDLRLGLVAFPEENYLQINAAQKIGESFVMNDKCSFSCSTLRDSIYHKAFKNKKLFIIDDLSNYEEATEVEEQILKLGIKNIVIAPLYHSGQLVGFLELGSPIPSEINYQIKIKLYEILSLFSIAIKRSLDELENSIQAIIKEECTAIHPSVEWRFRKAAINLMQKRENEGSAEMESIVFDNVYPLYGLSDIRHSSDRRNESIQVDLIEHLRMVKDIIISAERIKPMPLLEEINFRVSKYIKKIKKGLNSGDEIDVLDFLHTEIESLFDHLGTENDELAKMIQYYKSALDPNLHVFYRKRKDYESSVALINETITNYLDEAEEESQKIFPHYFEKYKTDGVEHGIYIGSSLAENLNYSPIYLSNLRLWQLMILTEIIRRTENLKSEMKIPLETTHLILVQNSPLSIRFRLDEKKFDVDGTYNLRYEIMKKRIDKAIIKGTQERLTQPRKIAIVYSQPKEAAEYKKYIDYLAAKGYFKSTIEYLELETMQGIQGLKALRVTADLNSSINKNDIKPEVVGKAVDELGKIIN